MAIFQAKNLSYIYNTLSVTTIPVINCLDLEINQGELVAITGASGSGKSTLLHLLGGVLKPQLGSLYIDNQNIAHMLDLELAYIRSHTVGFVYQQFYLLPKLSVLDNILLPTYYPIEEKIDRSNLSLNINKARKIASKLGIENKLNCLPNTLSGGEQQRVAIARALIMSPKIILADEPTGNLDKKTLL